MTKRTMVGDEMIEAQLKEYSTRLNISVDELIERYIRRELYSDDYYTAPKLSREDLEEISKRNLKRDIKNGFPPKKHNFDVFINRWSETDD